MAQYAVTAVFYIDAEDEDTVRTIVDQMVSEGDLHTQKGESWGIVEVTEVKF